MARRPAPRDHHGRRHRSPSSWAAPGAARRWRPAISPGKTVEGALGGLVGGVVGRPGRAPLGPALAARCARRRPRRRWSAALGIVGDLDESLLKRWAGVKDSGALFPGHGGMLDRLDSLLFGAPVLYYYFLVRALKRPRSGAVRALSGLCHMKGLSILGSTGSVGTNVLRIVDAFPGPLRGRRPRRGRQRRAPGRAGRALPAARRLGRRRAARSRRPRPAGRPLGGSGWASGEAGHGRGGDPSRGRASWWRRRWARSASSRPTAPSRRARTWPSPTRRRW